MLLLEIGDIRDSSLVRLRIGDITHQISADDARLIGEELMRTANEVDPSPKPPSLWVIGWNDRGDDKCLAPVKSRKRSCEL